MLEHLKETILGLFGIDLRGLGGLAASHKLIKPLNGKFIKISVGFARDRSGKIKSGDIVLFKKTCRKIRCRICHDFKKTQCSAPPNVLYRYILTLH